jgi:hypothetical protein
MTREEIARTPTLPHNARTATLLREVLRIYEEAPPWDPTKSVGDNWQRLCEQADHCVTLLQREVKILDHENSLLRELQGLRNPSPEENKIVREGIAYLDPGG